MTNYKPARNPDGTKKRRHSNNKGMRQIKRDRGYYQVLFLANRLGVPYLSRDDARIANEAAAFGDADNAAELTNPPDSVR